MERDFFRVASLFVPLFVAACHTTPVRITPGGGALPVPEAASAVLIGNPSLPRVAPDFTLARILALEDRRSFDREAFSSLAENLEPAVRARTARALGRLRTSAVVPLLSRLASDQSSDVRREAAFALGQTPGEDAAKALVSLAADSDSSIATEAVQALAKHGDAASLALIRTVLAGSASRDVKRGALVTLHRYRDLSATTLAAEHSSDPDRGLREAAIYSLGRQPIMEGRAAMQRALGDSSPWARASALRGLGVLAVPDDLSSTSQLLGDPDRDVRVNALRACAAIAGKSEPGSVSFADTVKRLIQASAEADPAISRTAVESLGSIPGTKSPEVIDALERALLSSRNDLREEAVASLGKSSPERLASRLPDLSIDPSPYLRARLAEAIAGLPVEFSSTAILKFLVLDSDPAVRAAVISAVREGEYPDFRSTIIYSLDDADPIVRAEALRRMVKAKEALLLIQLGAALSRASSDALNDAALAAVEAAGSLAPDPAGKAIAEQALASKDPLVRSAARETLIDKYAQAPSSIPATLFDAPAGDPNFEKLSQRTRRPVLASIETDRGEILVRLRPDEAPRTVDSFVTLAEKGFFDGIAFHRVVPNFVVQGGDPRGDGNGGPGYQIRDEINPLRYSRGAIGMALSGQDTGGSQFFFTHSSQPHLDGGYTVFGSVVSGRDVVDRMVRRDRIRRVRILEGEEFAAAPPASNRSEPKSGERILLGDVDPEIIIREIPGIAELVRASAVDQNAARDLANRAVNEPFTLELYFGTWSEESREVVSRLLAFLLAEPGLDATVKLVAVDRAKNEPRALLAGRKIERLPTLIVARAGRELGRSVEASAANFERRILSLLDGHAAVVRDSKSPATGSPPRVAGE